MKKTWEKVGAVLLVVGGINWGLAIFNVNLVTAVTGLLGSVGPTLTTVVYALVGVAGIASLPMVFKK